MEQIIDDGWPVIRNFVPEDAHRMEALHARWLQACPDMNLIPGGFYWAPGFAQGRNILCAYQGDGLVGHVAIYPQQGFEALGGAFKLWVDVRVDPTLPDRGRLRGVLLERAIARAREIGSEIGQPVALSATYFAAGQESIDDLRARGFVHYETVFLMLRNLSDPIPNLAAPQGVRIQSWRMESEAEQAAYVEACNEAFGKPLRDLGELRHWMHSETWAWGRPLPRLPEKGWWETCWSPTIRSRRGKKRPG